MGPRELDCQATLNELERVLASPGFARNERLSRFLRYIVERHLEGRDGQLKESLIGVHVFARTPWGPARFGIRLSKRHITGSVC